MRPSLQSFWLAATLLIPVTAHAQPSVDPLALVNPFVGNAVYRGATYPGSALPHSLVKLSPDTTQPSTAGYNPTAPILGFSHTHIAGTGGKAFGGQVRLRPQAGPLDVSPPPSPKAAETASPGYYAVDLVHDQVRAELTSADRAGLHRYSFPAGVPARVLVDLTSVILNIPKDPAGYATSASARFTSDREIEGSASFIAGYDRMPFTVHFVALFDQAVQGRGVWLDGAPQPGVLAVRSGEKQTAGLYAEFEPGSVVQVAVGLSYTSTAIARKNLATVSGQSFEVVRARAESRWRTHFNSIRVEGGTDAQRRQFYTALYHTVLAPIDVTGDNGRWAQDDKQQVYWDIYTLWDTFRTTNPLLTLIDPERQQGIIRHLLQVYQREGWLPDAWVYSRSGIPLQGGTHADNLIADAFVKKLGGFDHRLAYEAILKNASLPNARADKIFPKYGRLTPYFTLGYVPATVYAGPDQAGRRNLYSGATSRTLEYAYNDFSVSQVAALMGDHARASALRERSLGAYTLFHPEAKLFWAKDEQGVWLPLGDPNNKIMGWNSIFYEGTAWQYRFSMPHDIQGLIHRIGGNAAFLQLLDEYFDGGFHWQGNEPGFLTPWLHVYAGRPDKNVDRVRAIMARDFRLDAAGYPGDEDVGAMSAWYLFAAMGFFPNAGQDIYLLASPVFSKVTLQLGRSGKAFVIEAKGLSPSHRYVQSATLNGRPWDQGWFRHADIAGGAELVLTMGDKPSEWGRRRPPPSLTPAADPTPAASGQRP